MTRPDRLTVRRALLLGGAALLTTLSCGRDVTGPHELRVMRGFSFDAVFANALADGVASALVPFEQVRVQLTNSEGRAAVDSLVRFPSSAQEVSLALTVPLTAGAPASGETMTLTLAYVNAQGDTVFRGGPTSVQIVPSRRGEQPPPAPVIPIRFVGTGAEATQVQIAGGADSVLSGDAFSYTATALDGQGQSIPGTPIAWRVTPASRATIPNPAVGSGTTLPSRGPALVIAELLTGPADTVLLEILPRAQTLAVVSGNNQVARLAAALSQPLVVRVDATDGQPMAGVPVVFAITAGGGSLSADTVVTDAQGLASVTWTTGNAVGAQTVTATAAGLAASPVTFTATAPVLTLAFLQQPPLTATVGLPLLPAVTVAVQDGQGTIATAYEGPVSIAFGANPAGAVLGGTLTVNAVAGVATFEDLTIDRAGTGFTFVATASTLGLTSTPSTTFATAIVPGLNTWTNPAGGTWSTPTNWSLGRVPVTADTVAIALDGSYTVTLDTDVTVGSVVVGGGTGTKTLNLANRTVTVTTALQTLAGGVLVTGGGVINGTGTLSNGGQYVANGGTVRIPLTNLGQIIVRGGLNQEATLITAPSSTIEVRGNGEFGPSGMNVTTGFTNTGAIVLSSSDGPWDAAIGVGSGTLVNAPGASIVAVVAAGGNRYLNGGLDNQGTITVQTATFFTLSGASNINAGGVTVSGTLNLGFSGGVGTFTNAGAVAITGGSLALTNGTWVQATAGTTTGANLFAVTPGATLRLQGATVATPVGNSGTIEATDASSITGALSMNSGSLLRVAPTGASALAATLTVSSGFTNSGSIELTNQLDVTTAREARLVVVTGTLTNAASGTIRTLPGNGGGPRTITGNVSNQGVLQLAPGSPGTLAIAGTFTNTGTLAMEIGGAVAGTEYDQLAVSAAATLGGTLDVALLGAYSPPAGSSFSLVTAATITGTFATVNVPAPLLPTPTYGATAVTVNGPPAALINAWTNAAGGTWSTTTNWSLGRTPVASDTVLITLDGTYTVTMDVGDTAAVVIVGGASGTQTLAVGGRTLRVDTLMQVGSAGAVTITGGGAITGAGPIANLGTITSNGTIVAAVQNGGTLNLQGNAALSAPLANLAAGTLRVRASSAAGGGVNATAPAGIVNEGLIELETLDAFYSNTFTVGGTLVNAVSGTIRPVPGFGGKTLVTELDNQGLVDVREALTLARASAAHTNSGTIDLALASLTVTQTGTTPSFTNTGTITVPNGRTFIVSGGTLNLTGGTLNGNTTGVLQTTNATVNTDIASARARWTLTTSTVPGTFTIPAGDSLQLIGGSPTMTLVNNGRLVLAGSIVLGGTLTTGDTTSVVETRASNTLGGGVNATITNAFTNTGRIELRTLDAFYGNSLTIGNGTLVNAPGAILRAVSGFGGKTLAAQLDNQGLVDVSEALTLARASAVHSNSGTINLALANLTVTQTGTTPSFTNTGTITVPNGRTFIVTGGTLNLTGGTLNGNTTGVLQTTNTTVNTDIASARARWTLSNSTVPGTVTIQAGDSLQLVGGSPTMTLVNNGRLVLAASVVLGGTLTTGDTNSVVEARASTSLGGGVAATIANGFTNTGRIEQRTLDAFYGNSLTVTNGTLVNAPTGIIRSVAGFGGKVLGAQLDNQGLLEVRETYSLSRASSVHTNSGTIDLTVADLTVAQSGTTPSFTNAGTITIANGRSLVVTGGTLNLTGGTLTGATTGRLQTNGTTINTDVASARARWTLTNSTVAGTLTIPTGDSLQLVDGSPTVTLVNNGRLILAGNPVIGGIITTGGPTSVIETRASTTLGGGVVATITNGFTNDGVIELRTLDAFYGNQLQVTNGTLVNAPGGVIRSVAGFGGKVIGAQLDNQGLVEVREALTLARPSAAHLNSGTIDLATADFTVQQSGTTPSFTNTGTVSVPDGRTFIVTGGTLNLTGGTLDGNTTGRLSTNAATVNADLASVRARWLLTNSTVPGTFTIGAGDSLQLVGGSPTMTLVNNGRLILAGSTVLGGTLTTGDTTSVIELRASNALGGGVNATITNGFTNTGRIEFRTLDAFYGNSLAVTNGTLLNAPTGIIRSIAGFGSKTLAAQLDNQGLVDLRETLNLNRVSAVHVNSGTIDLATGNLAVTQSGTTPSFTNTGTILVAPGRTFSNSGGTLDFTAGAFGGQGGTLSTTGTTFPFTVPSMRAVATLSSTTVPGTLVIPANDSLRLQGGNPTMTIENNGLLAVSGSLTLGGTLTSGLGSEVQVRATTASGGGASVIFTNAYTNNGTLRLVTADAFYGNGLTFTNGTFVNASTGTIISTGLGGRSLAAPGGWTNNGTWTVDNTLSVTSGAIAQNNQLSVASGATLTLAGPLTLGSVSTTTVNGTLTANGGCTNNGGTIIGASCP